MFLFTGPLLLVLCLIALFLQSQFFPMLLCGFFAMFWLSFGLLQLPSLGLAASYAPPGTPLDKAAAVGAATPEFNAVVGLYVVVWAVFLLTFWVFSFRVNLVLNAILGLSGVSVSLISTSYFKASVGNWGAAATLNKVRLLLVSFLWVERLMKGFDRLLELCFLLLRCWVGIRLLVLRLWR